MSSHEAEAVVLRRYSLGDADRIIVFLSKEHGLLRAVASGVKRPKSRYGGCLELFNHVQLHYWLKEGAELGRVQQCEILRAYLSSDPTPLRLHFLSYIAELAQEMAQENYPNPQLFRLFVATLRSFQESGSVYPLLRYFEFWGLKLSGLVPDYAYCSRCGKYVKNDGFFVHVEAAKAVCRQCNPGNGIRIAPKAARLISEMLRLAPQHFCDLPWDRDAGSELERLFQKLLEFHLEKQLKTFRPLKAMLREKQPTGQPDGSGSP